MNCATGHPAMNSPARGDEPPVRSVSTQSAAVWSVGSVSDLCTVHGVHVAEYLSGTGMPVDFSRRPYLHPVRTLLGTPVTEVRPADHPHHYGVSLAIPDVNGTSYWGGRTFLPGRGSTMLTNHGQQRVISSTLSGQSLTQELEWRDEKNRVQFTEFRVIAASQLSEGAAWSLTWTSVLRAIMGPVTIGSPATNGRPGAGYGGIFWRLPHRESTRLLSASGIGESAAHESDSPWLAINQGYGAQRIGLLLGQPAATRTDWFVRSTEYVGAGPMLAAERTVTLAPGAALTTSLRGILLDRHIEDAADAERLERAADSVSAPTTPMPTTPTESTATA